MKITRKQTTLLFGLKGLIQKIKEDAKILEVEIEECDGSADSEIRVDLTVKFGPTHQLKLLFIGGVNVKENRLGTEWSLFYSDEDIRTEIGAISQHQEGSWESFRADLGL